jgi:Plasmid encoded RepA protein
MGVGEVHQLVLNVGATAAREMASNKLERQCTDTAVAVLQDDRFDLNILHSGFAMTALPHRKVSDHLWERTGGHNGEIVLHVESGHDIDKTPIGIPYGSVARLILIYLSTEAVSNNSRVVELGRSMKNFLERMGLSYGGKSAAMVREQARRISSCRLTFFDARQRKTPTMNGSFVRTAVICDNDDTLQPRLWNDKVELDEAFFKSLTDHPLPLREAAVRQLSGRSMALDLYIFFAYRLHVLERPVTVTWSSLHQQFGQGYKERWVFVQTVRDPLALALAAYPEANVEVTDIGLVMHPSPSPVPKVHPWSRKALNNKG